MSSFFKKFKGSKEDKNQVNLESSPTNKTNAISHDPIRVLTTLHNLSTNSQESQYIRLNPSDVLSKSELFKLIQTKFQDSNMEENTCKLSYFDVKLKTEFSIMDSEGVEDFMLFVKNAATEDKAITVKYQPNKSQNSASSVSDFPSMSFDMSNSIASFKSTSNTNNGSTQKTSNATNNSIIRNDTFSQETVEAILEKRYSDIVRLDAGAFGSVYKVTSRQNGKEKALKIMSIENVADINNALQEAMKMTKLTHPHIVPTLDVFLPGVMSKICIEMELMSKGSLYSSVVRPKLELNEKMVREVTRQVCSALDMMQNADGTIHRDIKPHNVLVRDLDRNSEIIVVALGDFGLAKSLENFTQSVTIAGTMNYLAPELVAHSVCNSGTNPFSFATDMFALGVTLYQIITFDMVTSLATLVISQDEDEFKKFISKKILERGEYSSELIDIIYGMMRRDPKQRLTADSIVSQLKCSLDGKKTALVADIDDLDLSLEGLDLDLNLDNLDLNLDDLDLDSPTNPLNTFVFLTEVDQIESTGNNNEYLDFKNPLGLILQKEHNRLIISNFLNSNLLSMDLTTKKIVIHTSLGDMPDKICYSTIDQTFVISFMGKVAKFSSAKNGKEIWSYPVRRAKGITSDVNGTIFASDGTNGNILVLSKDGNLLRTITEIGISFPTDLCLSTDNSHLIVCEKEKNQLLFVSKEGTILKNVPCGVEIPFEKPYVVNVDSKNNYIFVGDYDSNYLRMYDGKTTEYLTILYVDGGVCGCLASDPSERRLYAFYGSSLKIFTY